MTVYTCHEHRRCRIACRDAGASFGDTLAALDSQSFAGDYANKMRRVGSRDHFGTEVVKMPHFGGYHESWCPTTNR